MALVADRTTPEADTYRNATAEARSADAGAKARTPVDVVFDGTFRTRYDDRDAEPERRATVTA